MSEELINALAVVKPPTDCLPQCPQAFLSFSSSFLSLCLSPAFHQEIPRQDHLETTIANSVDPLHPRFCPSSCAFPLPKVDRCRASDRLQEILAQNSKQRPIARGRHLRPTSG